MMLAAALVPMFSPHAARPHPCAVREKRFMRKKAFSLHLMCKYSCSGGTCRSDVREGEFLERRTALQACQIAVGRETHGRPSAANQLKQSDLSKLQTIPFSHNRYTGCNTVAKPCRDVPTEYQALDANGDERQEPPRARPDLRGAESGRGDAMQRHPLTPVSILTDSGTETPLMRSPRAPCSHAVRRSMPD